MRGESNEDEIVHLMIGWTTRKDYPLMVEISLPIEDRSYDGAHEAQLWEETEENWIVTANHASTTYPLLKDRFVSRSTQRFLPTGMPESVMEMTVTTWKDGKAGYILFTPKDMIATMMADSETKILVEYENGYMHEGIGNAYTIQMVHDDFMSLTQNTWELYPATAYRRLVDGTIVHKCTTDYRTGQLLRHERTPAEQPPRVIEDRGRGSEIHNDEDKWRLLQYWAWARMPLDAGVLFPTKSDRTTEFWMEMTLQPEPDDSDPLMYLRIIKEAWMARLRKESPFVAAPLATLGDDFSVEMKYGFNKIRVWFVPNSSLAAGFTQSMAEDPCPRDKWLT
jgi:hypothetical protein